MTKDVQAVQVLKVVWLWINMHILKIYATMLLVYVVYVCMPRWQEERELWDYCAHSQKMKAVQKDVESMGYTGIYMDPSRYRVHDTIGQNEADESRVEVFATRSDGKTERLVYEYFPTTRSVARLIEVEESSMSTVKGNSIIEF